MGKNLLAKQARLNMSFKEMHHSHGNPAMHPISNEQVAATNIGAGQEGLTPSSSIADLLSINEHMETSAAKSYASAGQFELMSLLNALMNPKGLTASQILLTQNDFNYEEHVKNLRFAVDRLLALGIVPIINENDAVSVLQSPEDEQPVFSDVSTAHFVYFLRVRVRVPEFLFAHSYYYCYVTIIIVASNRTTPWLPCARAHSTPKYWYYSRMSKGSLIFHQQTQKRKSFRTTIRTRLWPSDRNQTRDAAG